MHSLIYLKTVIIYILGFILFRRKRDNRIKKEDKSKMYEYY